VAKEFALTSSSHERLADLHMAHFRRAASLSYLLTGDWASAEDLAQDAFIRAASRFNHLRAPDRFDAYLRRTIVNLHTSRLRHRRVERTYLESANSQAERYTFQPDVEGRDEVMQALRRLPIRQRAAIVLRYCEDLSLSQVADALGCSEPAAKNLIVRGLSGLRQEFGGAAQ
jgi:RNA polymerase sigma-70 factor (sigma-E family)